MNVRELEPYRDKIEEMKEKGVCNEDIAKMYHCTDMTICRFLRKQAKNFEKKCVICGKKFTPRTSRNVTCSRECGHERAKQMKRELYRKNRETGNTELKQINGCVSRKRRDALQYEEKDGFGLIRPYTFDSDRMLIEDMDKNRTPEWMADLYLRDTDDIRRRLKYLVESGRAEKIRGVMEKARELV